MSKNRLIVLKCLVIVVEIQIATALMPSCDVKNVLASFQHEKANGMEELQIVLNNCITVTSFGNKSPVYLTIENKEISALKRNFISNMPDLRGLVINNCNTKLMEPGFFHNAPKLMNIDITNGTIQEIPKGIFNGQRLISVHLDFNEIFLIDDHAFANMPTLSIFLNHNQLSYFKREWFTNTTELQALGFSYNFIRKLPSKAFDGFRNLLWLSLDHNEISVIYPDAFEGITRLDQLDLSHNLLTTLSPEVFPGKMRIQFLNLGSNLFNFLPNELLKKMSVEKAHIGGNPFKCPCLEAIYYWFYYVGVTVASVQECSRSDIPVCAFSEDSPKTCIETVDKKLTKKFLNHLGSLTNPIPVNCASYQDNANFQWLRKKD